MQILATRFTLTVIAGFIPAIHAARFESVEKWIPATSAGMTCHGEITLEQEEIDW